jgi:hypothetical protein
MLMRVLLCLFLAAVTSTANAEHLTGHLTNPDKLQSPSQPSCLDLKEALSFERRLGLLNVLWMMRLERGSYLSEKQDNRGTYYRAPPGGISVSDSDAGPNHVRTYDGGFYVPNDSAELIKIYYYYSEAAAPVQVQPVDIDCSVARCVKDPATSRISFVTLAAAGAIGGAAGGIIGRSMAPGSKMRYGQAAGAGAAGGLLGGAIIAWIENAKVGKIYIPSRPAPTAEFMERLRVLVAGQVPVTEIQASQVTPGAQSTATAAATPGG